MDAMLPLESLQSGHWFKLICGASYQHLPTIRNLALVYSLAGADCVDVAADPAIITAVRDAFSVAKQLAPAARARGYLASGPPWLMVSLNDGEDPHFRKADFQPAECPSDCPRPCQTVCPAQAIVFQPHYAGVVDPLCYGCGRCIPVCPLGQITARSYVYTPAIIAPIVQQAGIDAIEIHTQVGRFSDFRRLWQAIAPWADQLKLIAVSCPDGPDLIDYLWAIWELIRPWSGALIWQTDGRPMSGDIGDGTTRACLKLGQKVLAAGLPGFVQLAGGTNRQTVVQAQALGLLADERESPGSSSGLPCRHLGGIAYGSYARTLLQPWLQQLEEESLGSLRPSVPRATLTNYSSAPHQPRAPANLEARPDLLWPAVAQATALIKPLKKIRSSVAKMSSI
jgi:Fe-S-cluster-containing hydrogenase component 2